MKILIVMVTILLLSSSVLAEVYRWQDDKGRWHFTDKPYENAAAEPVELQPLNGMTAIEFPADLFKSTKRSGKKVAMPRVAKGQVVMYSTPTCGYCGRAKDYLKRKYIPYTEKDVSKPGKAQQQFASLGGRGVPLLLVGTKSGTKKVYGFNETRLASLLGI